MAKSPAKPDGQELIQLGFVAPGSIMPPVFLRHPDALPAPGGPFRLTRDSLQHARHLGQRRGGKTRAATKPAQTHERNIEMVQIFLVAIDTDGMACQEAIRFVAERYGLSVEQTRRIIRPRARTNKPVP